MTVKLKVFRLEPWREVTGQDRVVVASKGKRDAV